MPPPSVVVRRQAANSHLHMPRVEWNKEVQTLPPKAAAESLAHRVRLRGSHRRPQNPYTQIGKALVDFLGEDAVSIVDDESVGMIARQCLPELLECPFRCGMGSDVLVENPARSDLHHDQDVEGAERGSDHHKEVAGHNDLGMVVDEG